MNPTDVILNGHKRVGSDLHLAPGVALRQGEAQNQPRGQHVRCLKSKQALDFVCSRRFAFQHVREVISVTPKKYQDCLDQLHIS
jgi:hypothetical protein